MSGKLGRPVLERDRYKAISFTEKFHLLKSFMIYSSNRELQLTDKVTVEIDQCRYVKLILKI